MNKDWFPEHTVPYTRGFALRVPRAPGLYVIHDFRGALYAGRTTALRRRFDEHWEEDFNPSLRAAMQDPQGPLLFSWTILPRDNLHEAERAVIEILRPVCNRTL